MLLLQKFLNEYTHELDLLGFKDSRIQINLFAATNTFCYGINKQNIQHNYKTN